MINEKDSRLILQMTGLALDAVAKYSRADIRIHGEKNITGQPTIFVVNHFTRLETFFIPYFINKLTGKMVLSLAHHSFFGGKLGKYLEKLGAISTQDPERNKMMAGALLANIRPCLIFPEGQMIKDKKIVERGKYMIYNTGIRRPPHTGSGILALRTEFYRQKIKSLYNKGRMDKVEEYLKYFNLDLEKDLDNIINSETQITPVNITYYPIRARKNIINKIAEFFVKNLPERIEEELEVEGSILIDGADIDINFGEPISVKGYLKDKNLLGKIADDKLYLSSEEIKKDLQFKKRGLDLMYEYMDSIYNLTTLNHDHIFSYILANYGKKGIRENDFKILAYAAIDKIQKTPNKSRHTSLALKQSYLLTDDFFDKYQNFIDVAKSDGLIFEEDGYLYKNKERFSKAYEFHTIRKDNIVEVLKNEVEPLLKIVKCLDSVMRYPVFLYRIKIRRKYLEKDRKKFEEDYAKYYIKDESKPKTIGAPFFLKRFFNRRGILLIHGYMAAPEEIRKLAEYLFRHGYAVYGVRLRGHGTAPEDLASRRWEEWYDSVNRGYVVLKNTVKEMAISGFSTGAGLAILQSINKKKHFKGVVPINAPLKLNNIASRLASSVVHWNNFLEKIHIKRAKMEFVTNRPENAHINYFRNPVKGVAELEKFMNIVESKLNELNIPVLIIQGSNDPVVNPVSGVQIFDKIEGKHKELCRLYRTRHGIINGEGSKKIFARVSQFFDDCFKNIPD